MPQFDSVYEEKLYNDRLASLEAIGALGEAAGLTPLAARYPNSFRFTHTVPALRVLGEPLTAEALEAAPVEAAVAGRIMAIRAQGKAGFAQLQQGGERLQIYVRKDDVGESAFALYKLLHVGDHIGVRGHLMRTRTGELTLKVGGALEIAPGFSLGKNVDVEKGALAPETSPVSVQPITFLAKAMLALPDKYHGLEDVELRYRQRYTDLIVNSGTLDKSLAPPQEPSSRPSEASGETPVFRDADATTAASGTGTTPGGPSFPVPSERAGSEPATAPSEATNSSELDPSELPNVREVFVKRAAILRAIRKFFDQRGYLEVETPMLHTVAGGAAARPFTTHHNALDMPLSLRIAPELYLKRLVVGGLDRVYEINRNFRNEGVSTRHNPEFTMLEFYQAYANYHDLMDLTQELINEVAKEVNGTTLTHFNGHDIDLSQWQKLSMRAAIIKWWPKLLGAPPTEETFTRPTSFYSWLDAQLSLPSKLPDLDMTAQEFIAARVKLALTLYRASPVANSMGKLIATIFEEVAESYLIQPTIIYDFPLAVSPLSKVKPDEPDWVERFEFYIGGFEVGNAFSELNDPADQLARFETQVADKDPESMAEVDEDYIRALRIGLPPTAGEGIGIDRLTMLLTGSRSIRDVILFPLMRSQKTSVIADAPHGESAE